MGNYKFKLLCLSQSLTSQIEMQKSRYVFIFKFKGTLWSFLVNKQRFTDLQSMFLTKIYCVYPTGLTNKLVNMDVNNTGLKILCLFLPYLCWRIVDHWNSVTPLLGLCVTSTACNCISVLVHEINKMGTHS